MLFLQPYGGEMALRSLLLHAPAGVHPDRSVGAAFRHAPDRGRWIATRRRASGADSAFVTARFGNESFEAFSDNDVASGRTIYDVVPNRVDGLPGFQQSIKYAERVAEVRFRQLAGRHTR